MSPTPSRLVCKSPVDGRIYVERPLADAGALAGALDAARAAETKSAG